MEDEPEARPQARAGTPEVINRGILEGYLAFFLRQAEASSFRAFKRQTGVAELKPGWFAVLSLINDNPGVTPVAVARAAGRDKSTITPILRDLLQGELIRRAEIPRDRRSYALHLTPTGVDTLSHLGVAAAAHEDELEAILGARKADLLAMLRRIVTDLG